MHFARLTVVSALIAVNWPALAFETLGESCTSRSPPFHFDSDTQRVLTCTVLEDRTMVWTQKCSGAEPCPASFRCVALAEGSICLSDERAELLAKAVAQKQEEAANQAAAREEAKRQREEEARHEAEARESAQRRREAEEAQQHEREQLQAGRRADPKWMQPVVSASLCAYSAIRANAKKMIATENRYAREGGGVVNMQYIYVLQNKMREMDEATRVKTTLAKKLKVTPMPCTVPLVKSLTRCVPEASDRSDNCDSAELREHVDLMTPYTEDE